MMVTPQELKRSSFTKTIKGYATSEVDEYVLFVLTKYSELYNAHVDLERRYALAVDKLENAKSEENAISATIVNAQKMADAIVGDAKEKAAEIKGAVNDSCDRILDAYMTKVTAERDKLQRCEEAVAEFKKSLYDAYRAHLEMIDRIMPDNEPTPYLTDEELENKAVEFAQENLSFDSTGKSTEEENKSVDVETETSEEISDVE